MIIDDELLIKIMAALKDYLEFADLLLKYGIIKPEKKKLAQEVLFKLITKQAKVLDHKLTHPRAACCSLHAGGIEECKN